MLLISFLVFNVGLVLSGTVTSQSRCPVEEKDSGNVKRLKEGTRIGRIFGGTAARAGEIPWRVFLALLSAQVSVGGASILSPRWLLSAAHNFKMGQDDEYDVYAGSMTCDAEGATTQKRTVKPAKVYRHEGYQDVSGKIINDIALLYMEPPLTFDNYVSAICLPYKQKNLDLTGKTVLAAGWGATSASQTAWTSPNLQKVLLAVISNQDCAQRVVGTEHPTIISSQMCTFKPNADTCRGDSGTTIDYSDPNYNGKYFAVGVTSYGEHCGDATYPGVYTRVTEYLDWIEATTKAAGDPISPCKDL